MPFDMTYRQPSVEGVKKISDFARKTGDYASLSVVDIRVLAVTYDLEVEKVGTSHLRSEPVIKKTTEFYHPKVDREKLNKSDAKLPVFFMGEENGGTSLKKSESFDQFNYWREPMLDLGDLALEDVAESTMNRSETLPNFSCDTVEKVTEKQVDQLDSYLLKRPFFSGFEVTSVDFAVMEFVKELIINENLHSNLFRWSTNVSTHEVIDYQDVDVSKVMEQVEKNQDIVLDDVCKLVMLKNLVRISKTTFPMMTLVMIRIRRMMRKTNQKMMMMVGLLLEMSRLRKLYMPVLTKERLTRKWP